MAINNLIHILPTHLNATLTPAETTLLNCAQVGWFADFSYTNPNDPNDPKLETENNVENAESWGYNRTIRARLLNWLLTDARAAELVHYSGIEIRGAKIQGNIFIPSAKIEFPIYLNKCSIPYGIDCSNTKFESLALIGCHTGKFSGNGVQIKGSIFLRDGFKINGELNLARANIGIDLDCSNATINNPNGNALRLDNATIKGNVLLNDKFSANGKVLLNGATIHGQLNSSNSKFSNPGKGKFAISASNITVKQNIFLGNGSMIRGNARFNRANIGGYFDCTKGKFYGIDEATFSLEGATITGNLLLSNGFFSQGEVIIVGATINGKLDCNDGSFNGFRARNATVKNTFTFTPKENLGKLDLCFMKVGEFADNEATWPTKNGDLCINGFEYKSLDGEHTPISANKRLKWLHLQSVEPFKPQPYEQLAKAFKNMGHEKDASDVLIAKKDDLIRYGQLPWLSLLLHILHGQTIGYGHRPVKLLYVMFMYILIGWYVFAIANDHGIIKPSKERVYMDSEYQYCQAVPKEYPAFNAMIYSIDTFLPFVDMHQEDYYLPASIPGIQNTVKFYFWIHIAIGWALSTLFVALMTGIIKKE